MKNFKKNPETEKTDSNPEELEENLQDLEDKETENSIENSEEYQKLKEENAQLKNDFLRAYAEAENTKKRCAQEIEKNSKYAISSFAKELLSVADNLHRAIDSVADVSTAE